MSDGEYYFIRDTIHGVVKVTDQEKEVLNTQAMQRLRRIKQLSNTHLVFPGAVHTRFEHSIGVLHIASEMADRMGLVPDEKTVVRLAALVHDLGQGPYSHTFDEIARRILGKEKKEYSHETVLLAFLTHDLELRRHLSPYIHQILDLFENKRHRLRAIIDSDLDADKLDYLIRDSHYTGVAYGRFDLPRLLQTLAVLEDENRLIPVGVEKGVECLEGYRMARFLMHSQVYYHHARIAADEMLIRAGVLAYGQDETQFPLSFEIWENESDDPTTIIKGDKGKQFLQEFQELDDVKFLEHLCWKVERPACAIARSLSKRHLLKRGFAEDLATGPKKRNRAILQDVRIRSWLTNEAEPLQILEEEVAEQTSIPSQQIIAYRANIDNPLYHSPTKRSYPIQILLKFKEDGEEKEISVGLDDVSVVKLEPGGRNRFYVFGPKDKKKEIETAVMDFLEKKAGWK
ncbi:MAG: HD domain-containing protein [Candidatus Hodarchaeota archaeon]